MEFKGTKGEWVIDNDKSDCRISINFGAIDVWYSDAASEVKEAEAEANAKLIAAAPELLKEHITDLEHLKSWREKLIDAGLADDILFNEHEDMIEAKEKVINKALK